MDIKYGIEIKDTAIENSLDRLINQIFKLLPNREEGKDWEIPLKNLINEVVGMDKLITNHDDLFPLLCKLEFLLTLTEKEDFLMFRKMIFECLGLIKKIKDEWF